MIPLVEFFLHPFVALVDEGGRHMSHPSLVPIQLIKMDQVLKINVVVFRYLNILGVHHLQLVICYIDASKIETAVDKEIHEFWTVLDTTATTKMEQMLDIAATCILFQCNNKWNKMSNHLPKEALFPIGFKWPHIAILCNFPIL